MTTSMLVFMSMLYFQDSNFNFIDSHLWDNIQDIKKPNSEDIRVHMRTLDQTEAFQKYCAAFPALNKGEEVTLKHYMPPPAWCPQPNNSLKMQSPYIMSKETPKAKKFPSGKERRTSNNSQKKHKKRCNSFTKSLESKENLPEWVTHEGVWDMETQDPVKEFIRAIAMDEGYGTCANTLIDDFRQINEKSMKFNESKVPDWEDSFNFNSEWIVSEDLKFKDRTPMEEELFAKFEAKFDRSIEALWTKEQDTTPDEEYQDLPIDFHDLLSSPSDNQFFDPSAEKCSMISLPESIWSNDAYDAALGTGTGTKVESPTRSVERLHNHFKPLNISDETLTVRPTTPFEPFSLYSYEDIYDSVPSVADMMRSLTAINHSKGSSFVEVIPRKHVDKNAPGEVLQSAVVQGASGSTVDATEEDLLTAARTHFQPIERVPVTAACPYQYIDGDTFQINSNFDSAKFHKSPSGYMYLESDVDTTKRYLEYRTRSINYGLLNLTEAQKKGNNLVGFRLRFEVRQIEIGVQTEDLAEGAWERCPECGRGAKKMRPNASGSESIWSGEAEVCGCGVNGGVGGGAGDADDPREWDELLSELSAARALLATDTAGPAAGMSSTALALGTGGKRRHSASRPRCNHPHAPFLHCLGTDRPLTR